MVSARYRATFVRACPTGTEKKTESASAIARSASPATLDIWTSPYASSGRSDSHIACKGEVIHLATRPTPRRNGWSRPFDRLSLSRSIAIRQRTRTEVPEWEPSRSDSR
jgi:hypothetical protein